jgi:hypothetical protein
MLIAALESSPPIPGDVGAISTVCGGCLRHDVGLNVGETTIGGEKLDPW